MKPGNNNQHSTKKRGVFTRALRFWKLLGPGMTTGAADDDPSGIATYSQAGAEYGFQLLWLAPLAFPFMAVIQEMCGRLGLVTGRGLAANIRLYYSKKILFFCTVLLFVANTINIGADLGAMVQATQLLIPELPFGFMLVVFSILSLLLQILIPYRTYAKYLKILTFVLFSYVICAFFVSMPWTSAFYHTIIPTISFGKEQIILICAVLGTSISPYLFFWQTSQEVEEEILNGKTTIVAREESVNKRAISNMRRDTFFGMFFSQLVMWFIIATCTATLHLSGITNISSAADAAEALRPLGGTYTYLLFCAGIVGVGLLATPVLAGSAAYAISETFKWREGLYRKWKEATSFYSVMIFATLLGLSIHLFKIHLITALIYTAVINGIIAPVIMIFIVNLTSDEKIMGRFVNRTYQKTIGWALIGIMFLVGGASVYLLVS